MDIEKSLRILWLYNKKADEIEQMRFTYRIMSQPIRLEFSGERLPDGSGLNVAFGWSGPDREAIRDLVLTLRLFIMGNEAVSFPKMVALYETLPVERKLCEDVQEVRRRVNETLDGRTSQGLTAPWIEKGSTTAREKELTRSDVFYTFLYGDLAHLNDDARVATYELWAEHPFALPFLRLEFVLTLEVLLKAVMVIRNINIRALEQLTALTP